MPTIPDGLVGLLVHGLLPTAALHAAAEQGELRPALACRDQLPAIAVEACFVPGALPSEDTARALVSRPLSPRTIRHVLRDAGERRPSVLAALAGTNVPADPERQLLLTGEHQEVNEAVLANAAWPTHEQLRIARRAGGQDLLQWLSQLDPAVPLTMEDVLDEGARTRLDAEPLVALRALLRRPWLAAVPFERAGSGLLSAIGTVSADERTLYRLLGYARLAAVYGRATQSVTIVEAVACNPAASLGVQRRCRKLSRLLRCHYLDGWLPAHTTPGPLWEADHDGQRAAMGRIEELVAVRHRTVFSAGVLAANPRLAPDVRERIIAYLDNHLAAVDQDPATAALLAERLQVDDTVRERWIGRCEVPVGGGQGHAGRSGVGRRGGSGRSEADGSPRRHAWDRLALRDGVEEAAARAASRGLRRELGHDPEAWSIAWLLLREGWDAPLAALVPVVGTLISPRGSGSAVA